jgi:hypothetical protein
LDEETNGEGLDARVAQMRKDGAAWADIERAFGITRQQARYAYQKAKRVERRAERRGKLIST